MKYIHIKSIIDKKSLFLIITFILSPQAYSEVTLDGSMGSTGTLSGPDYQITQDLGKLENGNLFHSFGQFNINNTESATFSGSAGVKNIISRVTGGQASTIDGVFRSTIPGANVFFLNPSGIIFGENASLDVQGSFHASTADYLKFKDGVKFETGLATANPILTTASPEAFGFLDDAPANISVSGGNNKVLEVPENATLSLVGGDIMIDNRSLYAPSGEVILASAGSAGELVFNQSEIDTSSFTKGGNIHISHAADNPVTIINNDIKIADIDVSADSAGKIVIRGGQMVMDNAYIWAETTNRDGGDIDIGLAGNLTINGIPESADVETPQSGIAANSFGTGNAGNIQLTVADLKLTHGTRIDSVSLSSGNGGDLTINANSILLEGNDSNAVPRLITRTHGTGNAGNITLNNTNKLDVSNGAYIRTYTIAEGNTGTMTINTGSLELHDNAEINSKVTKTAEGNSGDLTINASHSINMSNNSFIANNTAGKGNTANLIVNADSISISDKSDFQNITNGEGNAGNLTINSNALTVKNGNILNHTKNMGNAGNLSINTGALALLGGTIGSDSSSSAATGQNGNIDIKANTILLEGKSFTNRAEISGSVSGNQNTGNLAINAENLEINDWAGIRMDNYGSGNTGDLFVNANEILMNNTAGGFNGISADLNSTGNSGNLTIKSKNLVMLNGARINISNNGSGNSGFLSVDVIEDIILNGASTFNSDDSLVIKSKISNEALSSGQVKNTFLSAKNILLSDSTISTNSWASSNGGNLIIDADQLVMQDASLISTGSVSLKDAPLVTGKGGNLEIKVDYLDIMNNSLITTLNNGEGNGGEIKIHAIDIKLNNVSGITTSTLGAGKAGNLTIDVDNNLLLNGSILATSSLFNDFNSATKPETAKSGDIKITANGQIRLENQSSITSFTEKANAGTIIINGEAPLQIHDNSIVFSSVSAGQGKGGDIFIGNPIVALDYSSLKADAVKGFGGNITISGFVFKSPQSVITASSKLNADGQINLKPETNISGNLAVLPESLLNASEHFSDRCVSRSAENKNSFVIKSKGGVPLSPGEISPANFLDYLSPESNDVLPETKSHSKTNDLLSYNNTPCTQ